jgi:hypothetical protein
MLLEPNVYSRVRPGNPCCFCEWCLAPNLYHVLSHHTLVSINISLIQHELAWKGATYRKRKTEKKEKLKVIKLNEKIDRTCDLHTVVILVHLVVFIWHIFFQSAERCNTRTARAVRVRYRGGIVGLGLWIRGRVVM